MVILRRTQRALLQATLENLWMSPDHGGLRQAEGLAVLPIALSRHLPNIEENNPPAPLPSPPQTPSYSDTTSKRARLDEGSFVAAFSTGATSEAGTRSTTHKSDSFEAGESEIYFENTEHGATNVPAQAALTWCYILLQLAHHHGPGHCNVPERLSV